MEDHQFHALSKARALSHANALAFSEETIASLGHAIDATPGTAWTVTIKENGTIVVVTADPTMKDNWV